MTSLPNDPHLILYNGHVVTCDEGRPRAEALAIRKHRIVAVGGSPDVRELAGADTQCIDLEGRTILPGLCDSHIHFYDWSLSLQEVQLAGCADKDEMLARVAAHTATTETGDWVRGRGWNESRWPDHTFPDATDLDRVTGPERPAILWRSDMHCAVVNNAALAVTGIDSSTGDPAGGIIERDERGAPTGVLKELAINLVSDAIPRPNDATLDAAFREGMSRLHSFGITAIHDQRMLNQDDGPRALATYRRLHAGRELALRVNCNILANDLPHLAGLGLGTGFGDDYLRLGHVKFFCDGSLGSRTAWMLAPFEFNDREAHANYGVAVTPPEELAAGFRRVVEAGCAVSVHAIGDRANRLCLDIFEELRDAGMAPPLPHRIEHVQTIDPLDLPRLAQLDITASVQPIHVTDDMDTGDRYLGARADRMYRFRSLLKSGARLVLGSDAPVADPNPFLGFHAALHRQRPERMAQSAWYSDECISMEQVIRGYTLAAAQAVGRSRAIGSIAPGKRADLAILNGRLLPDKSIGDVYDVSNMRVKMAIFDGNIVFQC